MNVSLKLVMVYMNSSDVPPGQLVMVKVVASVTV